MKINHYFIRIVFSIILCMVIIVPTLAGAQEPPQSIKSDTAPQSSPQTKNSNTAPQKVVTLTNPLKVDSVGGLIQNFVEIFSYIVILGAVLALIWVGLQFILSRGNPAKMNELKDWLILIIIGVAVVIGARLIIQVVINTLSASGAVDERTIQSVKKAASGN